MRKYISGIEVCVVLAIVLVILSFFIPIWSTIEKKDSSLSKNNVNTQTKMSSKIVSIAYDPDFFRLIAVCEDGSLWVRNGKDDDFVNRDSNNFIERK